MLRKTSDVHPHNCTGSDISSIIRKLKTEWRKKPELFFSSPLLCIALCCFTDNMHLKETINLSELCISFSTWTWVIWEEHILIPWNGKALVIPAGRLDYNERLFPVPRYISPGILQIVICCYSSMENNTLRIHILFCNCEMKEKWKSQPLSLMHDYWFHHYMLRKQGGTISHCKSALTAGA